MHPLADFLTVAQDVGDRLNEGIDPDDAENVILLLIAVCVVAMLFVLRTMQKFATRVVLSVLLLGLIGGLWLQRENLQDCRGDCSCRLFGQDVRVDPGTFCPP